MRRWKLHNPEAECAKQHAAALSRRTFLTRVGWGAGLTLLGGLGAWQLAPQSPSRVGLSFIEQSLDESPVAWSDVERLYVPLGVEKGLPKNSVEGKEVIRSFEKELPRLVRENKVGGLVNPSARARTKTYGVPDREPYRSETRDYCICAEQFLHERVKRLSLPLFDWVALAPGQDYREGFDGKGFIVKNHFAVPTVTLTSSSTSTRPLDFPNSFRYQGAKAIKYQDGNGIQTATGFVIIPTNGAGLMAPFSELLPLAIGTRDRDYQQVYGVEAMTLAVEAFSEAISRVLTLELLENHYRLRGARRILAEVDREILDKPQYADVPHALTWTQKHGVQACYDLFMEDMTKFNREIRK